MDTDQPPFPTQPRMALPRTFTHIIHQSISAPFGILQFGSYGLTTNDIPVALFALYV